MLKETVKIGFAMQMDETEMQVIGGENISNIQKSRMWMADGR